MIQVLNKLAASAIFAGIAAAVFALAVSVVGYYIASDVDVRLSAIEGNRFTYHQALVVVNDLCEVNDLTCPEVRPERNQ